MLAVNRTSRNIFVALNTEKLQEFPVRSFPTRDIPTHHKPSSALARVQDFPPRLFGSMVIMSL